MARSQVLLQHTHQKGGGWGDISFYWSVRYYNFTAHVKGPFTEL